MEWARVGFVAVVLLIVWSGVVPRPGGIDWVALVGIAIGGYPIFKEAIADLLKGRMTMELSMTIALAAAAGIGEFFTALLITLFVLVAEIIEGMTVGRGRGAIRQLLDLLPHDVEVRSDGQVAPRTLADVHVGDVVLVRPGGHIPVDGVVISGNSFVDQATITGESMPAEKMAGSRVFAGTINQSGVLEIHTDKIGADTAFGRIIEAVERAERSRAPIEKIADRLAGYLVYFALACAGLTFIITRDARSTISVIVVAGACGIAAGTPLAILGAIGRAAQKGVIIKGGRYLEGLSNANVVVLDKTGTLTLGTPEVVDVQAAEGFTPRDVVRIAAGAERFSEHPLAKAIAKRAQEWSNIFRARASCAGWAACAP
jgi:Cd2+/Zn2+-exporting ATPase/Cu+-exporting ATPase